MAAYASPSLADQPKRRTVVELFTSQGCSSCPPADIILKQLSKRTDVVALTLPVSYWDHLGWKDTLALEANNERQRAYAEARGDHEIYTPQMIVNGVAHVIGSRLDDIEAALNGTGTAPVALDVSNEGDRLAVHAGAAPAGDGPRSGTVWVAFFTSAINVDVKNGENNGRKLTYTNVVRKLTEAGRWNGEAAHYTVALPGVPGIDGCAAFLQADDTRNMLGVTASALATH